MLEFAIMDVKFKNLRGKGWTDFSSQESKLQSHVNIIKVSLQAESQSSLIRFQSKKFGSQYKGSILTMTRIKIPCTFAI
jgi:hypothetical protein